MADEGTPLLSLGTNATISEIRRNWGWIGAYGLFNLMVGTACLCYPIFASQIVELLLSWTVLGAGVVHLLGACCVAEDGTTSMQLVVMGLLQIAMATLMLLHPFVVLSIITIFIAVVFILVGSYQISLSRQVEVMAGRGINTFSGAMAVVMSILIIIGMPASSWYTIGVLLGVNYINIGFTRLIISCYGCSTTRRSGYEEPGDVVVDANAVPVWMT